MDRWVAGYAVALPAGVQSGAQVDRLRELVGRTEVCRLEHEGGVHTRSSTHLFTDTAQIRTRIAVILLINPELHQIFLKYLF